VSETRAHDRSRALAIETWFRANARDLPWRTARSAYAGLVSESMLQQTQVARVIERFMQFMTRFPTVHDLAAANEQDVLAIWQGLGYYRRARHLHQAARIIVDDHGGVMPADIDALRALPGVGRYTAGAIASIIFHQREPIVDGNVYRVLARLDAHDLPASDPEAQRWGWKRATELVQLARDPGVFNEGMMELGATICTPRAPSCDHCPVRDGCRAHATGRAEVIPPPKQRAAVEERHHHCIVVHRTTGVLLVQRPYNGLWAGLWQPPTVESLAPLDDDDVHAQLTCNVTSTARKGSFIHQTTHRRITCHVFTARTRQRGGRWVTWHDLPAVPMSSAHRAVLSMAFDGAMN
jgi:A/G-specific adenine glycosylase